MSKPLAGSPHTLPYPTPKNIKQNCT